MPTTAPRPELLYLNSDGRTPNNRLPVLLYRQLPLQGDAAEAFEGLFASLLWPPRWRSVVYDYQHYHSTAHEAIGVAHGWARLFLAGTQGALVDIWRGR